MKDPTTAAQKWSTNLAAATSSITAGVQAVTVAPGQAAARQKAAYVQGVNNSQDKWARNVAGVSLQSWQADMVNKGIPRIATGATAAEPKMATFLGQLLPYQERLKGTLPARGTLDQNIARMTSWVRGMSQFSKSTSAG